MFLVLAVFGLFSNGLIFSTLQFFMTYLEKFSLKNKKIKKNESRYIFSFYYLKKPTSKLYILKKLFVDKNITNFTAFYLHGNGRLNTFFHHLIKISQLQKKLCIVLHFLKILPF